jgi:parallel beta-helix repeat protein
MRRYTILMSICVAFAFSTASATVIHVPGDYATIQEGINACSPRDTVMVANGVYYEHLIIQMAVSLIGENRDNTIIDGSGGGDVVLIQADEVFISNFTITNGGNGIEDSGIEISIANNCIIELCKFNGSNAGLYLYASSYNSIERCYFDSNTCGIFFYECPSGPFEDNMANQIRNNVIQDNAHQGIFFEHMMVHHHSNQIYGNRIFSNDIGISMIMSEQNEISYNDLTDNAGYGITLGMCMGGGDDNSFHHNNFISNHGGLIQAADGGGGVDYWYSTADQEGNHWSDYTGSDNNGDGIGDEPYYVDGNESQDLYPLMGRRHAIIQGGVSDGSEPIENVYVQAVGTEIDDYTGHDGLYSLEGLGAGNYDISFSHPVYQDTVILAVPSTPGHTTPLDVVMRIETDVDGEGGIMPDNFALFQNYPNPFNAGTTIRYNLPEASAVAVEIFDLLGHRVKILVQGEQPAGYHQTVWDTEDVSSGVYFYRIQAGNYIISRRMLLLK